MNSAHSYSEGAEVPEDKTDNELIAQFMRIPKNGRWYTVSYIYDVTADELKYDRSWDWLMDVVDRIQDIEIVNNRVIRTCAEVTIYYKACEIEYFPDEESGDEHIEFTCQTQGESKIEAVYKAVVEFIKWYNLESLKNKPI